MAPLAPLSYISQELFGISGSLPLQYDYTGYLLVKPNLGIGLSVSYTKHRTGELGYSYYTHYEFVEYAAYAKFYFYNEPRRPYIDAKFGYAHAPNGSIKFGCYECEDIGPLYARYTSGLSVQPGVGMDFATASFIKWGLKLSFSANFSARQKDRHFNNWITTEDGIVKRFNYKGPLFTPFFGFHIYI